MRRAGAATLAYTASQASDGTVDGRTMSLSGGLSCGHERYDDSVYRDSSARGLFGLVRLRVASF